MVMRGAKKNGTDMPVGKSEQKYHLCHREKGKGGGGRRKKRGAGAGSSDSGWGGGEEVGIGGGKEQVGAVPTETWGGKIKTL